MVAGRIDILKLGNPATFCRKYLALSQNPPLGWRVQALPGKAADIIILSNCLETLPIAREISRRSYSKMVQNVTLAFLFNGIGIPVAATGRIYPVWAMVAMAVSVTAIFIKFALGHSAPVLRRDPQRRSADRERSGAPQSG